MLHSRGCPPGYRAANSVRLDEYFPPGRGLRPTLCVSDTHLCPADGDFPSDAPDRLLELLEWYAGYQIFCLGDLIESLPYSERELYNLSNQRRLTPLFAELRHIPTLRFVPGNHDVRVIGSLRRVLGTQRVFLGGFRVGRLVFVHGHEHGLDASPVAERYAGLVPLAAAMNHIGVQINVGMATNLQIAAQYLSFRLFPIFGHTHVPAATRTFANTGCVLAHAASFITIEGHDLTLWVDKS